MKLKSSKVVVVVVVVRSEEHNYMHTVFTFNVCTLVGVYRCRVGMFNS